MDLDIKVISAIAISLLSLAFSLFNFFVTRNDRCAEKRKEIINTLMEASLFSLRTQSHISKYETNANNILRDLGTDGLSTETMKSMKSAKSRAENLSKDIDSVISSIQNSKEMSSTNLEGLYIASKKLLVVSSHVHSETLANASELKK